MRALQLLGERCADHQKCFASRSRRQTMPRCRDMSLKDGAIGAGNPFCSAPGVRNIRFFFGTRPGAVVCRLQRPNSKNGDRELQQNHWCSACRGLQRHHRCILAFLSPQRSITMLRLISVALAVSSVAALQPPAQSWCRSQGKSGSNRPLQPSNDDERRPRRRPVRHVRPERGREARRAGAHRRRTGSTQREVPEGERERLRVHERFWGCHARARCPWYVPSSHRRRPGAWGPAHAETQAQNFAIAATQGALTARTTQVAADRLPHLPRVPGGSVEVGAGGIY